MANDAVLKVKQFTVPNLVRHGAIGLRRFGGLAQPNEQENREDSDEYAAHALTIKDAARCVKSVANRVSVNS
jgi:hypothetical protein